MLSRAFKALEDRNLSEILIIQKELASLKPCVDVVGAFENGALTRNFFSDVFIPEHLKNRDQSGKSLVALK